MKKSKINYDSMPVPTKPAATKITYTGLMKQQGGASSPDTITPRDSADKAAMVKGKK